MGLFSFFNKGKQDASNDFDAPVKPRRRGAKAQEEEPLDPMLPEKKRARRRLIGATALVLAAIIGLPMIFDSEPKPLTDDIAIQIPSRDKAGAPPVAAALPLLPEYESPGESSHAAPPVIVPKAEVKPDFKSDSKSDEKPPVAQAVKPLAEKPAETSGADKTVPHQGAAAKEKVPHYILQVAAVSSKARAEELQNRLKQAGIKSYTQKINTKDGERYRLRVGPFGNREEADKMRARLSKMGLSATVQSV